MTRQALEHVVVAGGTGLVGRHLVTRFLGQGVKVTVLTRNPKGAQLQEGATARGWEDLVHVLEEADALINLAGEGIADRRWSAARRKVLLRSRLESTNRLVQGLQASTRRPAVLVNASAIGYYGPQGTDPVDESSPRGTGFLAEVCQAWEDAATPATALGVRLVRLRIGIVLARDGAALPKMALPIRLGLGASLGDGRQGFSWIHVEDLVSLLVEAARDSRWEGAINGTAPHPVSQGAFTHLVAKRLHRPVWPVPAFLTRAMLRLLLGEMAEAMLLRGAFVRPERALALGFPFRFPTAEAALEDLL